MTGSPDMPMVSVVITVYNAERYINPCIKAASAIAVGFLLRSTLAEGILLLLASLLTVVYVVAHSGYRAT